MNIEHVIEAMEQYSSDRGMKLTTLGQLSVRNRHAYERLKSGTAQVATAHRIMQWIASQPEKGAA